MEQGAGEEGKAADGVGSGKERCTVTHLIILYPGVFLRYTLFPGFGAHSYVL